MFGIFVRLRPLVLLLALFQLLSGVAAAQQPNRPPNLAPGDAVVTGFSGLTVPDRRRPNPTNKSAIDLTFINPDGPSTRIVDVSRPGYVWDGRLFAAPKKFDVLAKDVGQVFGVALDDGSAPNAPPNIYVAATSAFGLHIVGRGSDGQPERRKIGGPGAVWMKGQFGLDLQGDPGSIYKVDGITGAVTLFAKVMLDGVPNPGPALGNLAYDAAHKQLFASDLYTGMIHRFAIADGAEPGPPYDHGVTGRGAVNLTPVPFNPANRPNIANSRFNAENPDTWGFAPPDRRVWGLAVQAGRLFYSVRNGAASEAPQIWSVGLQQDGSFAADARFELDVPAQPGPYPVSDIAFSQQGAMILAQRASIAGAYDYSAFTRSGEPRVLRFRLKDPNDPPSPGRWKPLPEEYAIGFAATYRNTDGGVALGYGYGPDGMLSPAACEAALWTTGQNLRNNPALRSQLEPGGPLPVMGLQGSPADAVRPTNEPPAASYFVDYDDKPDDPRLSGHMGSVRIPTQPCAAQVAGAGGAGAATSPPYVSGPQGGGGGGGCIPGRDCPNPIDVRVDKENTPSGGPGNAFNIWVTNVGPPITFPPGGLTVAETVPFGFTVNNLLGTSPNWNCIPTSLIGPGTINCTYLLAGSLATGAQLNDIIKVNGTITTPGTLVNCATVAVRSPSGVDTNPSNDRSCVPITTPVDVAVEKTGATSPAPEVPDYTFTLTVKNVGIAFSGANIITVNDPAPAGMTFGAVTATPAADWNCTASTAALANCIYIGSGPPATTTIGTITINALASGSPPFPPFTNCATVGLTSGSGFTDSYPPNDTSCVTVSKPEKPIDVAIKKTGEVVPSTDMPVPGVTNVSFTLAMTNIGPGFTGAPNVLTVTDVVPANMTFTGVVSAPDWTCVPPPPPLPINAGGTLSCTYIGTGPASPGAPLGSITITAAAKGDGPWENCADIKIATGTGVDANLADNHSCATITKDGFGTPDNPPPLPKVCGVNVIFVVDESQSIADAGATSQITTALTNAANILNVNGSKAALVHFSNSAQIVLSPLSTANYASIATGYAPSGATNWEAGLAAALTLLPSPNTVIFFITDGIPTAYLDNGGTVQYTTNSVLATNEAIPVVNQIYAAGVPIIGVGIGPVSTHLNALLGANAHSTPTYGGLNGLLSGLAAELCPTIKLSKSISPGTMDFNTPGPHQATVTLTVTNMAGNLTNVVVQDALPPELTNPTGYAPAQATGSGGVVTWTIPTLAANATATLTFQVTVSPSAPLPTNGTYACFKNFAQVWSVDGNTVYGAGNHMANAVTGPVHELDEAMAQICVRDRLPTLSKSISPNNINYHNNPGPHQVTVTLTFTNTGNNLTNVVIQDALPPELTNPGPFTPPQAIATGSVVNWTIPTLGANATATLSFPVTVSPTLPLPTNGSLHCINNFAQLWSVAGGIIPSAANHMSNPVTGPLHEPDEAMAQVCVRDYVQPDCVPDLFVKKTIPYEVCRPGTQGGNPCTFNVTVTARHCDFNGPVRLGEGVFNGSSPVSAPIASITAVPPTPCTTWGSSTPTSCLANISLPVNQSITFTVTLATPIPDGSYRNCFLADGKPVVPPDFNSAYADVNPTNSTAGGVWGNCTPFIVANASGMPPCPAGTTRSGGECIKPPPVCAPPLVPGPVAGQCICPPETVQRGRECIKLPPPTCKPPMVPGPVAGVCICPPGTVQRGKECVRPITCRPPLIPNAAGTDCVCPAGLEKRGRECVKPVVCNPPARLNRRGQCECPPDMVAIGKGCAPRERRAPVFTPGDFNKLTPRGGDNPPGPPRGGPTGPTGGGKGQGGVLGR